MEQVKQLYTSAQRLVRSTGPQDCHTAAYLFGFLVQLPCIYDVISQSDGTHNDAETHCLQVLGTILACLDEQVRVAESNLLQAAATKPMYPALHVLRHLISTVDLR